MEGKVIHPTSEEKLVNAVVLFAGTEGELFYDETLLKPVSTDEALNLFKKGLILVSVDGGFKRPTGITVTEGGYAIVYGESGVANDTVVINVELEAEDSSISVTSLTIDGEEVYANAIYEKCLGKNIVVKALSGSFYAIGYQATIALSDDGKNFMALLSIPDIDGQTLVMHQLIVTEDLRAIVTWNIDASIDA